MAVGQLCWLAWLFRRLRVELLFNLLVEYVIFSLLFTQVLLSLHTIKTFTSIIIRVMLTSPRDTAFKADAP